MKTKARINNCDSASIELLSTARQVRQSETKVAGRSELQLLLAWQPIFDVNVEIVAYELLFREFDHEPGLLV